jgi:hypothetical protein
MERCSAWAYTSVGHLLTDIPWEYLRNVLWVEGRRKLPIPDYRP